MAVRFIFKHFLIRIMAIAIHTSPELTGRTAELFIQEAESRPVTRKPLSKQEEDLLQRIVNKGREFRETLLKKHG